MLIGAVGLGSAWLQRAAKHAEQTPPDCVQRGYLLLPQIYMHRGKGDYEAAIEIADKAIAMGESASERASARAPCEPCRMRPRLSAARASVHL